MNQNITYLKHALLSSSVLVIIVFYFTKSFWITILIWFVVLVSLYETFKYSGRHIKNFTFLGHGDVELDNAEIASEMLDNPIRSAKETNDARVKYNSAISEL